MINKKSYTCLFIILILLMLGISVVSAEDNVDNTVKNTTTSSNTIIQETMETNQKIEKNEKQNIIETKQNTITHETNTTKKEIKKAKQTGTNTKTSEAPSTEGYNIIQVGTSNDMINNINTKTYYNLTNDINISTTTNPLINAQTKDFILNGNGYTITYTGTNNRWLFSGNANTNLTLYNVIINNYKSGLVQTGVNNLNIINSTLTNWGVLSGTSVNVKLENSNFNNTGNLFTGANSGTVNILNSNLNNTGSIVVGTTVNVNIENSNFTTVTAGMFTGANSGITNINNSYFNNTNPILGGTSVKVNLNNSKIENNKGNYLFNGANSNTINIQNTNITNLATSIVYTDNYYKNLNLENVNINGSGNKLFPSSTSGNITMNNVNISNIKGSVTGNLINATIKDVTVKNITGSFIGGTSTNVNMNNVNLSGVGDSVLSGNAGTVNMTDVKATNITTSVLGGTSTNVNMSNVNLSGVGASVLSGNAGTVNMTDVNIANVTTAILGGTSTSVNMSKVNITTVGGSIISGINSVNVNMSNVNISNVGGSILAVANTGLTSMDYVNTNNVTGSIIAKQLPKQTDINNSVFNNTQDTAITVGNGVLNLFNTTFNNTKKNAIYGESKTINIKECEFLNGNMSAVSVTGPGYVTISDTRFINNTNPGTSEDGTNAGGGAILTRVTTTTGYLIIDDCDFINNSATRGGAIFGNDPMVINITNSYFANNSAINRSSGGSEFDRRGGGGALYMEDGPSLDLINCQFENNTVTDPVTGRVTKNNIVLTQTTNEKAIMSGYNNQVDGVYVTDAASEVYGIYAKTQSDIYGFHTYVVTYNTTTTDIGIEATVNETITFEFTVTETNFHTELENVTINITFNNPNGTQTNVTLVTDTDGHAYYDYRSDIAGTVNIVAVSEDVYAPVLRNRTGTIGIEEELVYTGSTSNLIHTINRINTTLTSDVSSYTEYVHYAKNFTITLIDGNNNPVSEGSVDLIADGSVLDTQPIVDGQAKFSLVFNTSGTRTISFNYTGTSDVYNTSLITATANILSLTPVLSVNSSDVFVGQPISVNVSLTYGDDNRPAQYQDILLDLVGIGDVIVTTDGEGKASLTEIAGGIYTPVHHVLVDASYASNISQGFNRADTTSNFNVYRYNSSMHIVYKYGNRIGNISVYLNGSDNKNITASDPIFVTIRDNKGGLAGVSVPVVDGYGSVLTDVQFDEDSAYVTAVYSGNGTYNMNNTPTFEITANYPTVTNISYPEIINVEEEFFIRVNLTNDQGHPMSGYPMLVKINNVTVSDSNTLTNNMGYVDIPYTSHNNTSIEVFAMFEGDSSYEMSNYTVIIPSESIVRIPTSININVPESVKVNEQFTFNVTLTDNKGMINRGTTYERVIVLVNGEEVTATYDTVNDVYIVSYTPQNNTSIEINASYSGSNVYLPSNNSNTQLDSSKIVKIFTVLNVTASTVSTFAGDTVTVTFKLTTDDGTVIPNQKINITINGTSYQNVDLGSTGETNMTFTSPVPIDNVLVTASYPGTSVYNFSGNSTAFNITKIPTRTLVSVVNSTTGNVTLQVVVRTLDGHDTVVHDGTLQIDVGNSLTQYEPVNDTGDSTTFRLTSNPAPTDSIGIHVSYTGTQLYAYSEGVNASNVDEAFEYIKVYKQNATLNLDVNSSVFVGENVNITGVLRDGFDMPITYQDIQINITKQDGTRVSLPNNGVVRAGSDGSFNMVWENSVYGNYTVNATFAGITTVNNVTEGKTFKVLLIPTSTKVTIVNNTVGNVTLNVSVTDNRDGHGEAVNTGSLIVEYGDISRTVLLNSNETLVNLTITNTDYVRVSVVYVDNENVYDTSRDEDFNGVTAFMDQSRIELTATIENVLTETVTINGRLVDGLGNGFMGSISFSFNDSKYTYDSITTGSDGGFSFSLDAVNLGNISMTATFGGIDKVILGTSNSTSFNVNKIPTHTNVVIMGVDGDSEIVGVRVQNESFVYISSGNVELYVGNTLIKTISLSEYSYESYDENSYVKVALTKVELDSHSISSLTSITANYTGTTEYNSSMGSYDGSIPRGTARLNVTINQSTAYINESVDITVTLTDTDNHPISGQVEITIIDRTYPVTVTNGAGTTTIKYSNTTIGTYSVNGRLIPNALYEPTTDTENLEIVRIPTTTLVTVLGNAWNKTSIKIEAVNNLTNQLLDYGKVRVKIENTNKTDNYYDVTGEPIIVDIVTLYSGEFPISITYQENEYYQQSHGIDKLTANDTNEEIHTISIENQKTDITISTTSPVYVGDVLKINGTLYNKDTNKYLADQVIHFTINGVDRGTNTTDNEGKYVFYYTTSVNGTYIAQVTYAGITNIQGNTSQTSYTVNKINTTTIVSVINNTVGNVTLAVNVTDIIHDNIPVTGGTLNITIDDYSYTTSVTGPITTVKLDRITSSDNYHVTVDFMEDDKYLPSVGLDNNTLNLEEPSPLTQISVENQTAVLTVQTDKESYLVGESVIITGKLLDGLNNNITDVDLEVTVDGIKQPTARVTDGVYTTTYVTGRNGTINITVRYEGNETINPITVNASFVVEKINTTTIVSVLNDTVGNVTISVNVTGDDHKVVTDGNISITITGISEVLTQSVNTTGSPTIISLPDITTTGSYEITVEYLGNGTYNGSTGVDEDGNEFSSITAQLQTPILTITVPETDNYVLNNVTITGKLLDSKGHVIGGEQYVTLTFNNRETTEEILVNSTTGEYTYTRETHFVGDVNVSVNYAGLQDKFTPQSNNASYTIIKIPTNTLVTIVNNTYGNVNVNVEVLDTVNNKNVSTGWLHVTFNSEEYSPTTITDNVTNIVLNALEANRYALTILFNGTEYYEASTGKINGTNDAFDHIIVVKQNSTITINELNTTYVNDTLNITGRVTDGFNNPINDGEEINIQIIGTRSTVTRTAYITGGNGEYEFYEKVNYDSQYNITVNYGGTTTINASHNTTSVNVDKKDTSTGIRLINSTVGNITLEVTVKDMFNVPITTGSINISIGNTNYTKQLENTTNIYKLDEITGIEEVNLVVTYLGNTIYNPSTGVDSESGDTNITFHPEARNSTITIGLSNDNVVVKTVILVTGRLNDSLGNDIVNAPIIFEVTNGNTTETITGYTTGQNGLYAYPRLTNITGPITIKVIYEGSSDGTISGTSATATYTIQKIPTTSHITSESYTPTNITYKVWFTPTGSENILKEGWFEIKVNGSEQNRSVYYFNETNDNQKFNITITSEGYAFISLGEEFYDVENYDKTGNVTYVYVTYHGNEIYGESSTSISELSEKGNLTVNIRLDKENNKVNEKVGFFVELLDKDGNRQNARINITIGNTTYNNVMSSRAEGYSNNFTNETGREFTIIVNYPGSGGWNPATGNLTFTLEKLETQTLVSVISNVNGNLTLGVVVNDTDHDEIVTTGSLEIVYLGQSHIIPVNSGETIIKLDVENPPSSLPVTVTYLENPTYKSSTGVNSSNTSQPFEHIVVEQQTATISVNVNNNNTLGERELYFGDKLVISGKLTNPLGIVSGKDLTVTVSGTTIHSITEADGTYEVVFDDGLSYKGNGTFTVTVVYEGNDTVARATNQTNYTVYKIPTNTVIEIDSNIAGNVTLNVTVYDSVSMTSIKTGYVYFYNATGSFIALADLETMDNVRLPITTSGNHIITAKYIENNQYLNSTGKDKDGNDINTIEVFNQTPKITISVSDDSVILGESVTINGTVTNELNAPISGDNLVKISIGDDIYIANLYNGEYRLINVTSSIGEKTVNATFIGIPGSVNSLTSENRIFTVERIPTKTLVTLANTTVGNASIDVRVINATGDNITTGQLNVTVNNVPFDELVTVTGSITNIPLPSVTSMGEVSVNVEYVRNPVYDNSTGIDAKTLDGEETIFTGFNTTKQASIITVSTNNSNPKIGEKVNITGTLYDDREEAIDGTDIVNITIGEESYPVSVTGGKFSLVNITVTRGEKTVTAKYNGNNSINGSTAETSFNVQLIPTSTNVTIVSNLVENFTVDVVVRDYHNEIVTIGNLSVYLNGVTKTVPVNQTGTTRVYVDVNYARPNVAFTVTYLENDVYESSKGMRSTGEELTNITIHGLTPDISVSATSPRNVSQVVTINGTLKDELNRTLNNTALSINVNGTQYNNVQTDNEGKFSIEYVPQYEGVFTANVTYSGSGNIYGQSATVDFTVNRIETSTLVELVDERVDNVTIKVTVKGLDGSNVTSGKFNVTIDGINTTFNITGNETIAKLDITSIGEHDVKVLFLDNNKYINSTGKTGDGTDFNGLNATILDSHITVNADPVVIRVGNNVTISGVLTDDLNRIIPNAQVRLIFDDGTTEPITKNNQTDINGHYSFTGETHLTGTVNVTVVYDGDENKINGTNNSINYTVQKLPTQTRITVLNYTRTNLTLHIVFEDVINVQEIREGKFNVTVHDVYLDEYDIADYLVNGQIIFKIPESSLGDEDYDEAVICFVEDTRYLASNATAKGNLEKLPTHINITFTQNESYINETFDINIKLISNDEAISGSITYTLGETTETVNVPVEGYTITGYSSNSSGIKQITTTFNENRTYNGTSSTASFTINKLPTMTLVTILNDTVGNASIMVVVNDTFNNKIVTNGTLTITVGSNRFNYTITEAESIINLTVNKTNTYLLVNYLENRDYQSSYGVDNTTHEDIRNIDVKSQIPTMTITNSGNTNVSYTVTIEGDLLDGMNKALTGKLVIVTVNGTRLENITDENGHYTVYYTANHNGTYTAVATYSGNATIDGATKETTFTVSKIDTTTIVSVINNTVGNVTISVNVTGNDNSKVTAGRLNVTVNNTSTIYPISGEETVIRLGINTTEKVDVHVEFIEDDKYLNSTGMTNDSITSGNPEEFTGITADKENVTLIVNAIEDNVDVGTHIRIDITLTNGMGQPVTGYVNLTFNGEDEDMILVENGHKTYDRATHFAGEVMVNGTFYGNSTANNATATDTYHIHKIVTNTTVSVENNTIGNYTILVHVVDKYEKIITDGEINVTVNGVTTNHTITGSYTPILLANVTNTTIEYTVDVLYVGNDKYENSTGMTRESVEAGNPEKFDTIDPTKQEATLTIGVEQSSIYVFHDITYNGTLTDGLGKPVNATVNITVMYANEEVGFNGSVQVVDGKYNWTRTSIRVGEINVTVQYAGNDNLEPATASTTYIINKRPTITLVDVINNTAGNVEISITVKDNITKNTIENGTLNVAFNGETHEINITSTVTNVKLNVTGALTYAPLSVKYLGNETYNESIGVNKTSYEEVPENPEPITNIEVVRQTANMTITNSGDSKVGYTVVIEGYLKDGLDKAIEGRLISVTISNATTYTNFTDEDGHYMVHFKADHNGTYIANATFNGNSMVANQTVSTTFIITKLNTTTSVSVLNNTVGNVTLGVNVTDEYNNSVTSGQVNVTVNGSSTLYPVTGKITPIRIGLNTTEPVSVKVEFLEDDTYLNSTGITNDTIHTDNPKEFTGITADKENVTLIINALEENVDVGRHVTIDIRLTNGMGEAISGNVTLTFNGEDETEVYVPNGHYSYDRATHFAGTVTVRGTFSENSTANKQTAEDTYNINKIATHTLVSVENSTIGNVTIKVEVFDKYTDEITSGVINVTLNGTTSSHSITGKYTYITIENMTSMQDTYTVTVVYNGSDKYENSTGITHDSYQSPEGEIPFSTVETVKQNATITIIEEPDQVYVHRNVTYKGNLTDGLGNKLNGTVNITVMYGDEQVDFNATVPVVNGEYNWTRQSVHVGEINVTVMYAGNENINPASASTSYIIRTIPTATLVDVLNSTSGNVTIDVTVIDTTITDGENNVSTGTLQVSIPGKTFTVRVTDKNTTIPLDLTSVKPTSVTVKYLANEVYDESTGVNKTSYLEDPTNPEEFTEIIVDEIVYTLTVNATPKTVYIGQPVTINGTLLDGNGQPVGRTKLIIDINTDSETTRTDENGNYNITYTPDYHGSYDVNVTYLGSRTVSEIIVNDSFNVLLRPTTTLVSIENSTAGNVTLNVTVKDFSGETVKTGIVKVTDNSGNMIGLADITDENNLVKLNISGDGTFTIDVEYQENSVYNRSTGVDRDTLGELSGITIVKQTANLTVNTSLPEVYVGHNNTISGTLVDGLGNGLNTTVNIIVNGTPYNDIPVKEGKYILPDITINTIGLVRVNVTYAGNENISSINTSTTYNVLIKPLEINVNVTNDSYANTTINVTIVDPVDGEKINGTVKITLPNGTNITTPIENGTTTVTVDIPVPGGDYNVTIIPDDTNYEETLIEESITIQPRNSTITASVSNNTAGNVTVTVEVRDPVTGNPITEGYVNVTLNGETIGRLPVGPTGSVEIPVDIKTNGTYNLVANYEGTENYTGSSYKLDSEEIVGRSSNITVEVTNTSYANTTINITLVDPTTNETFNGTVNITLPNGTNITANITNGSLNITIDVPVPGGDINITYPGDDVHNGTNITIPIKVTPRNSTITASMSNNTAGNVTVDVEVRDPVTGYPITEGYVNVTVGDRTVGRVPVGPDGHATIPVDIKTNGTHDLVANYEGTENYTNSSYHIGNQVIVGRNSNITVEIINNTQANTTINITLVDPTTNETFNGTVNITLPNGTNITANITNGSLNVTIDVPVPGGDINITYPGDDVHNGTNITIPIKVDKRTSSITAETVNKTAGNVTVKVKVTDPITQQPITSGYVNITLNDEVVGRIQVDKNGEATIPTNIDKTRKITLVANYEGNENYTSSYYSIDSFTVLPKESQITANITNTTRGETSVNITLEDPVTGEGLNGTVIVTLPNGTRQPVNIENGTAIVPVDLPVGNNTIKIVYPGDDKYNETEYTLNVTVEPREINVTVKVTNNTHANTTINVTIEDPATGEPVNTTVTVTLPNGTNITVPVNGSTIIPIDVPVPGGNITVTVPSDETYEGYNTTIPVTVNPRDSKITATLTNKTAGNTTVTLKVVDPVTGKAITEGTVELVVDGRSVGKAPVGKDGTVTMNTQINSTGKHNITAKYDGKPNYKNSTTTLNNVDIQPRSTTLTAGVTNHTAGNTTVKVTVKDTTTGEGINATVIVTLPDGRNISTKATDGSVTVPVELPVGNNNIKVTYPGDNEHKGTTINVPVTVTPRDTKIAAGVTNNTAGNTTVTVTVQDAVTGKPVSEGYVNVTVNGKTVGRSKVDNNGRATIQTSINDTGKYVMVANYEPSTNYKASNKTISNVDIVGRDATLTVTVDNASVGSTKIKVTLKDSTTGKALNGNVTVTLPNGTKVKVTVGNTGTTTVPIDLPSGTGTISVKYEGDQAHKSKTITTSYKISKVKVKVVVDSAVGTIGEDITLTAHLTDEKGNPVNGGNLVFKLNGRSLRLDGRFDTNDTDPMKLQVVNGLVKFTMKADLYLRAGKNITASYSGSYKYESAKANVAIANIRKRSAALTVTVSPKKIKQNNDIFITVKLKDVTKNSKNNNAIYTNASLLLKINGVTLKDAKGENLLVPVTGNIVNYVYHVPSGTGAVDTSGNIRNYTVEAVYVNSAFYPDSRNKSYFNVERSIVNINIKSVTVKKDVLSVKANLTDYEDKLLVGKSKVCLKINGKTYKQNGKAYYATVHNGKIDLKELKLPSGTKVKSLTIVAGERQPYYGAKITTTDILTS